jgi:hypothetical protein
MLFATFHVLNLFGSQFKFEHVHVSNFTANPSINVFKIINLCNFYSFLPRSGPSIYFN